MGWMLKWFLSDYFEPPAEPFENDQNHVLLVFEHASPGVKLLCSLHVEDGEEQTSLTPARRTWSAQLNSTSDKGVDFRGCPAEGREAMAPVGSNPTRLEAQSERGQTDADSSPPKVISDTFQNTQSPVCLVMNRAPAS